MNIRNIIKEEIESFLKEEEKGMSKDEFFSSFNIDPEELRELGSGDFGTAYSTGDGRVLKDTRSKSEFDFAKQLAGKKVPALDGFVDYYFAGIVDGNHYILMEEVDEDSSIDDKWYEVESLLSNEGFPMQYVHMLDIDELDLEDDIVEFISDIEDVNSSYRYLGVEASDIKPDNLGYDKSGKLKAFDIDDRSINERQLSNEK